MFVIASDLNIENTNIKAASGVTLDEQQKTLVGSVLDVSILSTTLDQAFSLMLISAVRRPAIIEKATALGR